MSRTPWLRALLVILICLPLLAGLQKSLPTLGAAAPRPAVPLATDEVQLPPDTLAFLHVNVHALLATEPFLILQRQLLPEAMNKLIQDQQALLGIDPRALATLTFALVFHHGDRFPVLPIICVRTKEPFEQADVLKLLPGAKEQAIKGLYVLDESEMGALRLFSARTFVGGPRSVLQMMGDPATARENQERHAAAWSLLDKHHAVASLALTDEVRQLLKKFGEAEGGADMAFGIMGLWSSSMFLPLVLDLQGAHATFDMTPNPRMRAVWRFGSEPIARRMMRISHTMVLGAQMLATFAQQAMKEEPELSRSFTQGPRMLNALIAALDEAQIDHQGKEVNWGLEVKLPEGTLNRALLEAVVGVRESAQRMTKTSNARQIVIAMHNYHNDYNRMPGNFCDEQGKPLLSWRVALLPYIENNNLFQEFRFTEPWDSEHNKKLIDRMPSLYRFPGPAAAEGKTHWQVFMRAPKYQGRYAPLFSFGPSREQTTLMQISATDGTSNTLCVVEATNPVIWTKPDDIMIDEDIEDLKKPAPQLGANPEEDTCVVVFADGSARHMKRSLPDAAKYKRLLRTYIGFKDGEVPEDDTLFRVDRLGGAKPIRGGAAAEVPPPLLQPVPDPNAPPPPPRRDP